MLPPRPARDARLPRLLLLLLAPLAGCPEGGPADAGAPPPDLAADDLARDPPDLRAPPDLAGTCTRRQDCAVGEDCCGGRCVDVRHDPDRCGACGTVCPAPAQASRTCVDGACGFTCAPDYADCNVMGDDGCEVDLSSDAANCGACMNTCMAAPGALVACRLGRCEDAGCQAGLDDCNGLSVDGCEAVLATDPLHCGACGAACLALPQATPTCAGGACAIASCNAGFDSCDGDAMNGCEAELASAKAHCGGCGNACPDPPNATGACVASACTIDRCDLGFSDCNANAADGCEFNVLTDPNNCGACGVRCHSGTCQAGACACERTVLVLKDDSDTGTQVLATALTAAGYTVTISPVPVYQYNGTNPAPRAFGAIVVLAGGPSGLPSVTTDMPAAGQQALVGHVKLDGGGLVLTEWAAYHVASNRWQTLKDLVLLGRTVAYSGQVTYTVDPGLAAHPIWSGLPASFTFASTSNVGVTKVGPGILRVAGSAEAIDAVALRDAPVGRVVHLAHAGNYAPNGWTNTNVQKLVANAVGWVARCP